MTLRKSDTHDSTGITMLKVFSTMICSVATDNLFEFVCARCESLQNAFAVYIGLEQKFVAFFSSKIYIFYKISMIEHHLIEQNFSFQNLFYKLRYDDF